MTADPFAAPATEHLSPAEQELRAAVRRERQLQSALTGCVVGGGAGAILALVQGNAREAMRNAAIGCLAGGVIGLAYGSYVDARAQSYANEQERLARLTAAANEDVARYRKVNAVTQRLIDEERRRIAALGAQAAATGTAIAGREQAAAGRAETIRMLEAQVQEIEDNIKTIEADQKELASRGLDAAPLDQNRFDLREAQSQLSAKIAILKSIPVAPV